MRPVPTKAPAPGGAPAPAVLALALLAALAAIALGTWLRLAHLLDETPVWDEWHALRAVKDESFAHLATTFAQADRSIPFALYFETLTRTRGLDDLALRAPFTVAGLATLLLVPLAFRRLTTGVGAALLASALALSPLLIFFSRTARPYAPALLGSLLALAAYGAWRERAGSRHLCVFGLSTTLTLWMLPVYAPFCLAPAAADLALALLHREPRRRRLAMAALAAGAIAPALLLAPSLLASGSALSARIADGAVRSATVIDSVRILAGSDGTMVGLVVAGATLAAALRLLRDRRAQVLLWAAGGQIAAILVARPRGLESSLVLTRYLLPAAVATAILAAAAASRACSRSRRRATVLVAGVIAALALIAIGGPLPGWLPAGPSNLASKRLLERIWTPAPARALDTAPLPAAYRTIAEAPGAAALVEVPFFVSVPARLGSYQLRHRRELFVGVTAGFCSRRQTIELPPSGRQGFALRRFVALDDLERLAARGVRWVVFHPNEEARLRGLSGRGVFYDFDRCVDAFSRITGRRPRRSDGLAVFDLEAPKRGRADRPRRRRRPLRSPPASEASVQNAPGPAVAPPERQRAQHGKQ